MEKKKGRIFKSTTAFFLAALMLLGSMPLGILDFSEKAYAATGEIASRETVYFPSVQNPQIATDIYIYQMKENLHRMLDSMGQMKLK